jgi:predicted nucleic-acid-binding protein
MADNTDIFYLEKMYPDASNLFSSKYKTVEEILPNALIILDTNVLLSSFDTSENTIEDIKNIFNSLKSNNRLFLPARVAREFVNNRGKKIGELYQKMRQTKENLNKVGFKIDEYPLLSNNKSYSKLKDKFEQIDKLVKESRKLFEVLDADIKNWHWNDNVSQLYNNIFTSDIIIELKENEDKVKENLKFRMLHKIAPGYNDSNKPDDGVGDLIIWKTIIEIGASKARDVIFVSNDQKNDWFYKQDKVSLYPKYELFDEFRRITLGQSINIITFANFLGLMNAKENTIKEIKATSSVINTKKLDSKKFKRGWDISEFKIGDIVEHPGFGYGNILNTRIADRSSGTMEVHFLNHGIKYLYVPFAPLRIASEGEDIYADVNE